MRNKLFLGLILLSVVLGCLLPVSAQETETLEAVIVTDDLGREVEIPRPLTSVVTLAPSLTEMVYFLDGMDMLAGCDMYSDYPEETADLDKFTNWDSSIIYEALVAADPDLVLTAEINSMDQIKDLEDLGMTVFYFKNPTTFEELYESVLLAGEVLGKEDEAEALAAEMEERVAAVDEIMAKNTKTPLVFYELDSTDPTKPWTAGAGTFISMIIEKAGGKNLGDDVEGAWIQVGLETLIDADPEIILLGDYKYGNTPEAVAARTGWDGLTAVAEGQMYGFDDNLVSRPGPRLVEGLETIAQILHPELF